MNGCQDKIQQHYDEIADIYDHRYDKKRGKSYYGHISRHVMENLPKKVKLLDLGCGTGLFVQRYVATGGLAVGLDISRGMVRRACKRCAGSSFTVGTAEVLPFKDASFDALSSLLAFSYLNRPDQMLAEAYRVLKPGGTAVICTLGKNVFTSGLPAVYQIGEVMKIRHVGMGAFNEHYYSRDELFTLFSESGFSDIHIRKCSFAHLNLIDPLYDIARKIEPFVEENIPYLAYNIIATGKKPAIKS